MIIYEGKAVFEGVAIGKLSVYKKNEETVKREKVEDVDAEVARYAEARAEAVKQLQALYEKAVKEGRAVLLIIAEDASDNTKKRFHNMGTFYQVPVIEFSCKDGLGSCIGRAERSSLALTDAGLAEAVLKALDAYNTRR